MLRRQLFSLLTVLAVLLLSGLNQSQSHAARCCRAKQKSACCACQPTKPCCQPCEECCEPCKLPPCICIDRVFYGFPGYYLHYAKSYPDCSDCNQFTNVIHQHTSILSQTTCPNCMPYSMYSAGGYCLDKAVDPKYDIDLRIMAPDYEAREYLMGTVELPNGTKVLARVLLLKIKVGKPGNQHTETFAFGLETTNLPTGTNDDLGGMEVTNHQGGTCLYKGTVLGDIPCFIMTTKY